MNLDRDFGVDMSKMYATKKRTADEVGFELPR